MEYFFLLTNLNNDETIAMLSELNSEKIEFTMRLHNILDPRDIGIQIIELESEAAR